MRRLAFCVLFGVCTVAAQNIPLCVSPYLSAENDAVQQNQGFIQKLNTTLIDDVFKAYSKGYYEFVADDRKRLDCTRVVFIFNKATGQEWGVRARIGRVGTTFEFATNNGPVIMATCNLGLTDDDVKTLFQWKKAVQDKVGTCFDESMRLKDKEKILRENGFVARNVQDRCYEGGPTPDCLVLPLPFLPPYTLLAKSRFRIVYPVEDGPERDVEVSAGGQCAKYSDKAMRDLDSLQKDLELLRGTLRERERERSPAVTSAQQALETAASSLAESRVSVTKRNLVLDAIDTLLSALDRLTPPVAEVPARMRNTLRRLKEDMKVKPIDQALVVKVGKDLQDKIQGADWTFSRVEVLTTDGDLPDKCTLWKTTETGKIPFTAPAAPPGGQQ